MKSRIEQSAITSRYVTLKNGLPFTSRRSAKPRQIQFHGNSCTYIQWRLTNYFQKIGSISSNTPTNVKDDAAYSIEAAAAATGSRYASRYGSVYGSVQPAWLGDACRRLVPLPAYP